MVANEVLYRSDLSLKAKGMFAYLFSKPDGWDFSGDRIAKETKDGRKVVYAALKELEDSKLLKRCRLSNGKVEYFIEYADHLPETGSRVQKPIDLFGQEPKRPVAETGSINNKEKKVIRNRKVISTAETSSAPFSLPEEIRKLEDNDRRDMNIIALYFDERKPNFESREQYQVALKRHLRASRSLVPFSDDQIIKASEKAKREYPEWTLETVMKILTK